MIAEYTRNIRRMEERMREADNRASETAKKVCLTFFFIIVIYKENIANLDHALNLIPLETKIDSKVNETL